MIRTGKGNAAGYSRIERPYERSLPSGKEKAVRRIIRTAFGQTRVGLARSRESRPIQPDLDVSPSCLVRRDEMIRGFPAVDPEIDDSVTLSLQVDVECHLPEF